jgi:hypothetical protein
MSAVYNNGPSKDLFAAPLLKNYDVHGPRPNLIAHLDEMFDNLSIDKG